VNAELCRQWFRTNLHKSPEQVPAADLDHTAFGLLINQSGYPSDHPEIAANAVVPGLRQGAGCGWHMHQTVNT
jgi:hypothetical protein